GRELDGEAAAAAAGAVARAAKRARSGRCDRGDTEGGEPGGGTACCCGAGRGRAGRGDLAGAHSAGGLEWSEQRPGAAAARAGGRGVGRRASRALLRERAPGRSRSEEHTSELQSRENLVCL